jgi:hypothetical protein
MPGSDPAEGVDCSTEDFVGLRHMHSHGGIREIATSVSWKKEVVKYLLL